MKNFPKVKETLNEKPKRGKKEFLNLKGEKSEGRQKKKNGEMISSSSSYSSILRKLLYNNFPSAFRYGATEVETQL